MARFPYRLFFGLCFLGFLIAGCTRTDTASKQETPAPEVKTGTSTSLFQDVAPRAGLKFTHVLGNTGKFYFHEFTAPGCAFIDYDGDGNQDVFLVQSGSSAPASTVKGRPLCALYHNLGNGTFEDVTRGSGIDKDLGYGQGVAVGDYDNDGFDDLFITAYGGNHLFHNAKGSGKFQDVTQAMGLGKVKGTGYATSAAWGDYDGDGRLDLYVCYYTHWNHALDRDCTDAVTKERDYCRPQIYQPETHQLFHNGGKKFEDVSERSGITKARGRGLAVAFVDYNGDGKQDIFVANDVSPNMLWKNNGNGTFSNAAQQSGVAYDGQGQDMASMGIAIGDYNQSGYPSLYVSNYSDRPNILFQNSGQGIFQDSTQAAGLATLHLAFLSFGCEFVDYDADGWIDLIINNGHVQVGQSHLKGTSLKQRKQLLHNEGSGRFKEIVEPALLGDLSQEEVGRGLATGDFDNDGRVDVLAVNQNSPVQLFHNETKSNDNHFVSFLLQGTKSNRNAIGAKLELQADGAKQTNWVLGGSSYLSSSDRRVYFGLGKGDDVKQLSIVWPSGLKEVVRGLKADTFYNIIEGKGVTRKNVASKTS